MRRKIRVLAIVVIALVPMVVAPRQAGADHSVTTLVSAVGNGAFDARFEGTSVDGTRVFYVTREPLVTADTDASLDVYERSADFITLLSFSDVGGTGPFDASFEGASANGARVFFETKESLVTADTDNQFDIYERFGDTTTLISIGPAGGNGPFDPNYPPPGRGRPLGGTSEDGTHVFFTTNESLVAADTDASADVYERSGATTTLISTGPAGGNGPFLAIFQTASADGERVIFSTDEPLVAADTDARTDLYERFGGATTLLSIGPGTGNADESSDYEGASADATRMFFETDEPLVSSDTDGAFDLYERFAGTTSHISTGPGDTNSENSFNFIGNSTDGARVFFSTLEPLVAADTDASFDIYERSGGTTTLISTGPAGGNGPFDAFSASAVSDDGTRVIFETEESLVAADTDASRDLYERFGGTTTLISTGPAGGNGPFDVFTSFETPSTDGARVFFYTDESLVSADTDATLDVYERFEGTTTLLSTGPTGGNGAFDARIAEFGSSEDGTRVFFETAEALTSGDTDTNQDVYAADIDTQVDVVVSTRVSLRFKRGKFSGRVRASSQEPEAAAVCVDRRQIRVKKARPGRDPVVAGGRTNARGRFTIGGPPAPNGRYYAKVVREARGLRDLEVTCLAGRSGEIRI